MFGVTGSILFTISICIERYITICRPFFHNSRPINWKTYVLSVIFLTVTLNITFWICNLFLQPAEYAIIMLVSLFLLPCVILIVSNAAIISVLNKNRKMFYTVPNDKYSEERSRIFARGIVMQHSISRSSDRASNTECQTKLYRQRKKDTDLAIISLIVDVVFVVSQLFLSLIHI